MAGTKKTKAQLVSADITLIPSGVPDGVIASNHRQSNEDAYTSSVNKLDDKVESQTDLSTRTRLGATEDFNHAEGDGKTFVTFEEAQALAGGGTVTSVNGVSPVAGNVAIDTSSDLSTTYYTDKVGVNNSNGDGTEILAVGVMNAGVMLPVDKAKIDKYPDTATNGKILQGNGSTYVEVDPTSEATNLSITNRTATTLDVASDTGTDATVPSANATQAGLMTATDFNKSDLIEKFNTDLLRYKIAPVIPADSTGDNAIITRIYANTNYLRTTGSLPTQIVYVSPTGNDLTGQKGNFYAPYTPAGGVAAAVAGDTIMWIGGNYGTITTGNLAKANVSHRTFGHVNVTFTTTTPFDYVTSGGGAGVFIDGEFNFTSSVDVIKMPNLRNIIKLNNCTQSAGSLLVTNAGGLAYSFTCNQIGLSGTGVAISGSNSYGVKHFINIGLITGNSSSVAVQIGGIPTVYLNTILTGTGGAINTLGELYLFGSIVQSATATSTIAGFVYGGLQGGIFNVHQNKLSINGDLRTCTITSSASGSIITVTCTCSAVTFASGSYLTYYFRSCIFGGTANIIDSTNSAQGNKEAFMSDCTGTIKIIGRWLSISNCNLTAPTNDLFYNAVGNFPLNIYNSTIEGNNATGVINTDRSGIITINNSKITNNNSTAGAYIFGNTNISNYYFNNAKCYAQSNGQIFSNTGATNKPRLEGINEFFPKLLITQRGSNANDSRVRLTATGANVDFSVDYNGMINVNSTAFGMNITSANFLKNNTFTYVNTNANTVTITVNAPLNFLNGTTATTKDIAQNEIFEFVNIDGNNIIIK